MVANPQGGAPVSHHFGGDRRSGYATPNRDAASVADHVLVFVDDYGLDEARQLGLASDDESASTKEGLRRGIVATVMIEITLEGQPYG